MVAQTQNAPIAQRCEDDTYYKCECEKHFWHETFAQ